ncbi:hypothetical protein Tco_0722660, partial [Tanacetum coccineum]
YNVSLTLKIDRDSRFDICMEILLKNIDIVFKQSKFSTSRDGYVIEGELKEYGDSCETSSVQIKFKVKDFIQAIKESSCKRRSKLAFENADFEFESRVDTFRDKEIYLVI